MIELQPGLKVAAQMAVEPSEEDFAFARQMGVDHAVAWADSEKASADYYCYCRELYERNGVILYGLGNNGVHNVAAITLNLEDRDAKIEQYKRHIRDLGVAKIPYTTYAHMANGVWSTPNETTRGGAPSRAFDLERVEGEGTGGLGFGTIPDLDRDYSEEEIWDNFAHFAGQIAPVAEEAGVRIGIHPDDPPGITLGRVPRPIFSSFDGYKRAFEIADSPNVGMCLCIGCWLEGGESMGAGVEQTIRYFGGQNKIFKVHCRNVDQPLPHFVETFVDDGYYDMYPAMKTLEEVGFEGVLIPDHIPTMADDGRVGTSYTMAYMKALVKRAQEELGA
ncbi:MAG: mannonate dehydratase [Candidatus Latescibacterota bacterium]|nr:mannonate dehydratase [Candidatus Latescibacterota bacterium]